MRARSCVLPRFGPHTGKAQLRLTAALYRGAAALDAAFDEQVTNALEREKAAIERQIEDGCSGGAGGVGGSGGGDDGRSRGKEDAKSARGEGGKSAWGEASTQRREAGPGKKSQWLTNPFRKGVRSSRSSSVSRDAVVPIDADG